MRFKLWGLPLALLMPLVVAAQNNPVRLTRDVLEAATLDVPIDPATTIDPASKPRGIGRRSLARLGLASEQLATARATHYSASRLEDASGSLAVFHASVVKDRDGWVFWSEDLPQEAARSRSEVQLTFRTESAARYLVDFAIDSAEQEFAVVVGDTRTTQLAEAGHLALVIAGTGRDVKVRLLPLGDASYKSRRFTLFEAAITPIL